MIDSSKIITKNIFLSYYKKPYPFLFLTREEVDQFFSAEDYLESLGELKSTDLMELLRSIDSHESIALNNLFIQYRIAGEKLLDFYKTFFSLPNLSIWDHSAQKEDATQKIKQVLQTQDNVFFYKPTLTIDNLQIKPTVLYKYKGKIYLIEHFWSSSLKQEALATFSFYNLFFKDYLNLTIDQYLISYLSREIPQKTELIIKFGNSLPFTSKIRVPDGYGDEKMKNINTFFGTEMEYEDSLYELIMTPKDYYLINNEPWEFDIPFNPREAISFLSSFLENPQREIDLKRIIEDFLSKDGALVSLETVLYKTIIRESFENSFFSSSVLPFKKTLLFLNSKKDSPERIERFLQNVVDFKFLNFPKDQDYIVFSEASVAYSELKTKVVKVYYDFESVSLPYPYLERTKPYTQLVLQLSLIKTVNDVEVETKNIILDPLKLKVDDFKKIIDAIYTEELDSAYIVYNKSFENTRLKEMVELIGEKEYSMKVTEIIDRTIDLANWFTYGNNPHIIHKKLRGFHSIKQVIKHIPQDIIDSTKTVQYSILKKCKNGVMAQELLKSRALCKHEESDRSNWDKNQEFLKAYCENDVRSMIAVEFFIERLIKENKHGYYDKEQYLEEKIRFKRLKHQ